MDKEFLQALSKAEGGDCLSRREIMILLACADDEIELLTHSADQVRQQEVGDEIWLRGLIEFSNVCSQNCLYCGLRADNHQLGRYRMTAAEIALAVQNVWKQGIGTVVLQSGEDPWWNGERIAGLLEQIRAAVPRMAITLSIGERTRGEYSMFRQVGADRFLMRHETANPDLYARLHPHSSLGQRRRCLEWLKEEGYEVGSGSLVGLPGQTIEDMALDIELLRDLDVDMAGIGPFIPHPATPMKDAQTGSVLMTIKMLAITRLVCRNIHIPVTTALATLDDMGREKGWQGGANVVMPNATPLAYKKLYQLYPDKRCLGDDLDHCRGCLDARIRSVGRVLGQGAGPSPKWEARHYVQHTS